MTVDQDLFSDAERQQITFRCCLTRYLLSSNNRKFGPIGKRDLEWVGHEQARKEESPFQKINFAKRSQQPDFSNKHLR